MRVELTTDGGLAYMPGLAKPMVVDGSLLSPTELAELQRLCERVVAARTPSDAQPLTIPDGRRYRLTIESGDRRHDLDAADPIGQPAIAELIAFVQRRGRRSP